MQLIDRDPVRIRLTGRGGQGIMLGGAILAEAAMRDGLLVSETQEYGPEARLGATKADLIVSTREIAYPEVEKADLILCLSRAAYLRYAESLAPGGLLIADSSMAEEMGESESTVYLPFRATALELGNELTTNIIGLGALVAISEVVTRASLAAAVAGRVKPEFAELNDKALEVGFNLGASVQAPRG